MSAEKEEIKLFIIIVLFIKVFIKR